MVEDWRMLLAEGGIDKRGRGLMKRGQRWKDPAIEKEGEEGGQSATERESKQSPKRVASAYFMNPLKQP